MWIGTNVLIMWLTEQLVVIWVRALTPVKVMCSLARFYSHDAFHQGN